MTATWAGGNHGRCAAQPGAALRAAPGRLGGRHVDSIWPLCLISRRARHGLVPAARVLTSGSFNRSSTSFHREIHPGEQGVIALIVAQTA